MVLMVALVDDDSFCKFGLARDRTKAMIANGVGLDNAASILASDALDVALLRLHNEASSLKNNNHQLDKQYCYDTYHSFVDFSEEIKQLVNSNKLGTVLDPQSCPVMSKLRATERFDLLEGHVQLFDNHFERDVKARVTKDVIDTIHHKIF